MIKETPMLFTTEMVNAILAGHKTQTRRLVKEPFKTWFNSATNPEWWKGVQHACPYGGPGDLIYVRESFYLDHNNEFGDSTHDTVTYRADGLHKDVKRPRVNYDNVDLCTTGWYDNEYPEKPKWKPNLHMPKRLARIYLKVVSIRPQKLQDITQEDCLAEGIVDYGDGTYKNYFKQKGLKTTDGVECLLPKASFQSLICSINGLDVWDKNPWVWVIEFEVLSSTGRPNEMEELI